MSLETPEKIRTLQRKLYTKAKQEPAFRFYLLHDKIHRADILAHAHALCRAKGGASGVDGETFEGIEEQGRDEWLAAREEELRTKTYRPDAVRRVMIPKPGGGERPLGIPTIRDRVIQMAAKLVLEPIFEADFEDSAHGYRPGRSAHDAVEQVKEALEHGYTDVVDADVSKYFDTIPHADLMLSVARRISDKHVLHLIKLWLKAPVEERDERGNRRMTGGKGSTRGTPQGGVLSPLLANIYINRLLRAWREGKRGAEFRARIVNYADDFVIVSRGRAEDALAWTKRALTKMGLALNETKTRICDATREPFDFLGYTFGPEWHRRRGHRYLTAKPSTRSIQRVKQKVRAILDHHHTTPIDQVVTEVNAVLVGWRRYFSIGTRAIAYRAIDAYVDEAMRNYLQRRHKVSTRGTRRFPTRMIYEQLGVVRMRQPPSKQPV